jgi:drug/metabolite transporter (DMT)-like permease
MSIWLGIPVLGAALWLLKVPFKIPRTHWRELLVLSFFNMFIWHGCIILAITLLSSGRAAILGYTMPIFSAVLGALFFRNQLHLRGWLGVGAAALGVLLLLTHEFVQLAGRPMGVALAVLAAATWALGTQLLRRTQCRYPHSLFRFG